MDILATVNRIADGILETDALVVLNNARVSTDFHAEVTKKSVKNRGRDYEFDVILHFEKGVYTEDYTIRKFVKDAGAGGEQAMEAAFDQFVGEAEARYKREIKSHLEDKNFVERGLGSVVGYNEADDYEYVEAKVKGISLGKAKMGRFAVEVPAKVHVVYTAKKLPDMSQGPYDQMSDRELKELIGAWASEAPENFWMDGEYRGSAAARTRDLMRQWRGMGPRQQMKHFEDLRSWIRY